MRGLVNHKGKIRERPRENFQSYIAHRTTSDLGGDKYYHHGTNVTMNNSIVAISANTNLPYTQISSNLRSI